MSITVHFFGDIDRIVDGALAVDDGVVAVEGVTENNRVHTPELLNILNF